MTMTIATKYDPNTHAPNYCMSSNISGVIGSAVPAGVLNQSWDKNNRRPTRI